MYRKIFGLALAAGLLGAAWAAAHDEEHGALVHAVAPGGPAARAGVAAGDRLLSLAGRELATHADLEAILAAHTPGDTVSLTIGREEAELELELTFGESSDGGPSLGVSLALAGPAPAASSPRAPAASSPRAPAASSPRAPAEEGLGRAECLEWVDRTYRVKELARELDPDLAPDYAAIRACIERDTKRMRVPIPVTWCDNVFKVHCSGLDLITVVGDALIRRCEDHLERTLETDPSTDADWRRCGRNRVFDDYSLRGAVAGPEICEAAFQAGCDDGAV